MARTVTSMASFSNVVRVFPYPVLEDGNLSFSKGRYDVEMKSEGGALTVEHQIVQAPLIERLVNEGRAACCCTASVPKASYREIYIGSQFSQVIELEQAWLAEPAIIRPVIVCCKALTHTFNQSDGVDAAWVDQKVSIEKGAKLAVGPVYRLASSLQALLSVEKDEELEQGRMIVHECTEDGYYFRLKVATDLYKFIQSPGDPTLNLHRRSILTHAVSSCFTLLAKNYGRDQADEEQWRTYSNLKALAQDMENREIDIWDAEDFSPEKAATAMWPHIVPEGQDEDV